MTIKMPFGRRSKVNKAVNPVEELLLTSHYTEAIDLLSASNLLNPSVEAEARLIELRHEALFHIESKSSLESWPPNSENRFSAADGIPEVGRDEFNVENLRAGIFNNGSLIVRNLISPTEAQATIADVNRAFDSYYAWGTAGEFSTMVCAIQIFDSSS
jgi:hypothetical protein